MADLTPLCALLVSLPEVGKGTKPEITADWSRPTDSTVTTFSAFPENNTLRTGIAGEDSGSGLQEDRGAPTTRCVITSTHDPSVEPPPASKPPASVHFATVEPATAAPLPDGSNPSLVRQLLTAANHHGSHGPAAALHIVAVTATSVRSLQTDGNNSTSSSSSRPWTRDAVSIGGPGLRSGGHASHSGAIDGSALHDAAVWLAGVASDSLVSEPAARAALGALADLLTAALRALLAAPSSVVTAAAAAAAAGAACRDARDAAVAAAAGGGISDGGEDVGVGSPPVSGSKEAVAAAAAAAAAARVLYDPSCHGVRLTGVAIAALYERCADPAAVAAAARLLGCCLQLQVQLALPPPPSAPSPPMPAALAVPALSTQEPQAVTGPGRTLGAARLAETALTGRPVCLSDAAGWGALLELRRHPHPLVRAACLDALQQACASAAAIQASVDVSVAAVTAAATAAANGGAVAAPRHLLDPAAASAAYAAAAFALSDDAEEPRAAAASLVSALALLVPELPYGTHFGVAARLVDDAFMRLCAIVSDPLRGLKLQALRALGGLHAAGLRVKLQALSKKTTLRVAAPPPGAGAAPPPTAAGSAAAVAAPGAVPNVVGWAASGAAAGGKTAAGKRGAGDSATAAASGLGVVVGGGGGGPAKRLTTSAWEPQSWLAAARSGPGLGSGSGSGSGSAAGSGTAANDDLTLLENAVGAFVLGSEDEHWEVRAATLDSMTRLAEYEYQAAVSMAAAAAAAAAAAQPPPMGATVEAAAGSGAAGGGGSSLGNGGGGGGGRGAAGSSTAAAGLSVRIGGIGGTAGSRIAAGGGNAEAAAAICEALVDALLDELPEVRQVAARSVDALLRVEAAARRQLAVAEAAAPAAPAPSRRVLPPLLTEEQIRTLAAAARDTDGETRRAVVRALGRLRLTRPALLRDVVQALLRCVAANPTAADWRAAAAAAWRLGAAAPAATAAVAQELSPPPKDLPPTPTASMETEPHGPPLPLALQQLSAGTVLRLLVLAAAHAVQPDVVTSALPPHVSGRLLVAVGRGYRP